MGFEAPIALLGLLAAGIPVIAHLVRRRDLPVVELPTIALLERAHAQSRRRMRLVDLLLLIARIALVTLLAIAVAAPYVEVRLAYGDGRIASVAIVLDDSMSMARAEGDGRLLDDALARARDAIDSLPPGSEVAVVLAGAPPRLLWARGDDLDAAEASLDEVSPSARATALPEAVAMAMRELHGARHEARRLLVLTDGARHSRFEDVAWPEGGISVDVVRVGEGSPPNRAVTSAVAVPDPTTPGQASVSIEVRSFGAGDGPVSVALRRGETVIEESRVELSGGIARATLHGPLVSEGDPTAAVTIESDDALATDDARPVLLRPPAALRVLLVDGDPHASRDRDEVGFVARAIEMAPAAGAGMAYRTIDADTLASHELAGYDVVVLANVRAPAPDVAERLLAHVEAGGGLLVTGGDQVAPRAYAAVLDPVLPARPRADGPTDPPLGLLRGDGARALEEIESGLANVRVHRRLLLEPPLAEGRVELAFDDGAPALVTGTHGEGRTAILAIPLDDDWSDLPYRPGYLPLVIELLSSLSARSELPDRPVAPGEPVVLVPPPGATRMVVVSPDGERTTHEGGEALRFTDTDLAGAYRVLVATTPSQLEDDPRGSFVVAPPPAESDLSAGELPTFDAEGEDDATAGAIVRRSIAPWLFLVVGLLAIAEALFRMRRLPFRRA